ncbi:hypothetical protein [Streptacidiphilus jiangxiensis]|uniref:Polyketide cyclase / dehydrase and lipid transport n=1 Tax=Streptacidiphilus jiangxiensis TaxID=235985 RepID=A0A1H7TNH6_STRJI|nr:hypothetical protein [Streptacidiphilus jiangxiensis]SEL86243.1 hypothetical protein SAMN05414137_114103 [Streptacidiphilus jiangxiensis]
MTPNWPVADFDPVRRLRVLAAGISGAVVAERAIPVPFDRLWRIVSDLEHELGTFEVDMRNITLREVDGRLEAHARGRLGFRARFDVQLESGWCWMQSRFLLIGIAAVPARGGTLVAATGGFRLPGRAALFPLGVGRANAHALVRLARRAAEPDRTGPGGAGEE